jgi:DNA repair exonuclease SbcCD ATPase subunit
MSGPVLQAHRIDSDIRRIHEEVQRNVQLLKSREAEMATADQQIPALQSRVSSLRASLSHLESENADPRQEIKRLTLERSECDDQNLQLSDLCDLFQPRAQVPRNTHIPELSDDLCQRVHNAVNGAISAITTEYTHFDVNELNAQLNEIAAQEAAVERELSVLRQFALDDWIPVDRTGRILDEFCLRSPSRNLSENLDLSNLPLPIFEGPPIVLERSVPLKLNRSEFNLQKDVQNFITVLKHQQNVELSVYQGQLQFFESLLASLESTPEVDPEWVEEQVRERAQAMQDLDLIAPLYIPESFAAGAVDPIDILCSTFAEFCRELEQNHQSASILAELEESAGTGLSFPEFQKPIVPRHVKRPVVDSQLTEFGDHLKRLAEITKKCQVRAVELGRAGGETAAAVVRPVEVPPAFEGEPGNEEALLRELRIAALERLPPSLGEKLEASVIGFPKIDDEVIDDDTEFDQEAPDQDLEDRAIKLNSILSSLASIEISPLPPLTPPPAVIPRFNQVDTQPVIDAVSEILSPVHQNAASIEADILDLDRRLGSARLELASFEEEEDLSENETATLQGSLRERLGEVSEIRSEYDAALAEVKKIVAQKEELERQNVELQAELDDAENIDAELTELRNLVRGKAAELAELKNLQEETRELRAQLLASRPGPS